MLHQHASWLTDAQRLSIEQLANNDQFTTLKQLAPMPESSFVVWAAEHLGCLSGELLSITCDPDCEALWGHWSSQGCLPLYDSSDNVVVAVDNPFSEALAMLENELGKPVMPWLTTSYQIQRLSRPSGSGDLVLEQILNRALELGASDLVIHATELGSSLSYRVAGQLQADQSWDVAVTQRIFQIIKLDANLDIGERHRPQDGRLQLELPAGELVGRVSIIPSLHGEDCVIRLLAQSKEVLSLAELGFSEKIHGDLLTSLRQPHGLILVTGPTGSGKTTSLYGMLAELTTDPERSIVSLEDPIEAQISGVRQSQVDPGQGYNYQRGLSAMLRQDPDIMMIGEIRDETTAKTVLEAAYTGHLILSTLHTGTVLASLLRLIHLGCDPFMLRYSLKAVVSQRLSRRTCQSCEGKGCSHCNFTGHHGRQLSAEALFLDPLMSFNPDPSAWLAEGRYYPHNEGDDLV